MQTYLEKNDNLIPSTARYLSLIFIFHISVQNINMFWSNYALKWMYYLCIHLFIKSFILYTCMYKMYILYANVACKQTFFRSLFFFIIYYYTNVTFSLYERCYLEKGIAQLHRSVGQNFSKRQGSYHLAPG